MLIFPCEICKTQLSAEESQAGSLVRCPTCLSTLRVPASRRSSELVGAGAGAVGGITGSDLPPPSRQNFNNILGSNPRSAGKRYGFNCGYCSSRLEATESMAAQEGQCPTCGKTITIPILDRYGRLIDPKTRQIIKQDPHPVHAYAAAGDRAPVILRQPGGAQNIQCPRCKSISPITANNCKACGMPFTMEGTTLEASGASNGFCVASLVLGIIGIPASCTIVTPILAIIFGAIGLNQASKADVQAGGKGMAIAGITLGIIGCLLTAWLFLLR
jgi:hypothetical protein